MLNIQANNRGNLRALFRGDNFRVQCSTCLKNGIYNVTDIVAISSNNETGTGALVGGLVGLLGGPIGMIIGGSLGAVIGDANDAEERKMVTNFNESW